ncbi:redoxin domain-containing protein [Lewinella sp. JB7]|uniref:TlpA family protein disulfide reductase n=1 Tax=Lewinella sp. JB7 TaxID=2962887 RepID=UPI0020CA22E1
MSPGTKKDLIFYGVAGMIALLLYVTGLHTQAIAYVQQGILATGLIRPDTELVRSSPADTAPARAARMENLDFRMVDAAGEGVSAESLAGKVIFLNLWAVWCPPCLAEMPGIDRLYRDFADDERVAFVLLNVERDFTKGRALVEARGFDFPVYQLRGPLPAELASSTLPTTYVLGPTGEVLLSHRGMADYDTAEFREVLERLVGGGI